MRMIDADIFESVLDFADSDVCEESPDGDCDFGFSRENIRELLQDIPSVDAVPVVRCRECKHLNVVNRKELYAHCPKTNTVFLPFELDTREHFCSLGERKEGAD